MNALGRQCEILPSRKRKTRINSLFDSQFSYCALIWLLCRFSTVDVIYILLSRKLSIAHGQNAIRRPSGPQNGRNVFTILTQQIPKMRGSKGRRDNNIFMHRPSFNLKNIN